MRGSLGRNVSDGREDAVGVVIDGGAMRMTGDHDMCSRFLAARCPRRAVRDPASAFFDFDWVTKMPPRKFSKFGDLSPIGASPKSAKAKAAQRVPPKAKATPGVDDPVAFPTLGKGVVGGRPPPPPVPKSHAASGAPPAAAGTSPSPSPTPFTHHPPGFPRA